MHFRKELVKGVAGLKVSSSIGDANEDGVFFLQLHENELKQMDITLTNTSSIDIELAHCEMMRKCRVFTLNDSKKVTDGMASYMIKPGN